MARTIEGDFAADGAVCVRAAFSPAEVDLATEAIEAVLADLSPTAKRASADDDGAFVEDFCRWREVAAIEELARTSAAAEIAGELTGSTTVRMYHDHVLVKEAGTRQRTPWHQDLPYYNVDGRQVVSMWMPVDPVPRESSLELVAGSHLGPWFMPRTFLDGQAKWFPEGTLAELPAIDGDPETPAGEHASGAGQHAGERASGAGQHAGERASGEGEHAGEHASGAGEHRILAWDLAPGDAVFFHMLSLHGAAGFTGPGRRRVLSLRFLGDDAVHAPRPWDTPPPFPGLVDEIAAGAPMDHPLFPLLWTAP